MFRIANDNTCGPRLRWVMCDLVDRAHWKNKEVVKVGSSLYFFNFIYSGLIITVQLPWCIYKGIYHEYKTECESRAKRVKKKFAHSAQKEYICREEFVYIYYY